MFLDVDSIIQLQPDVAIDARTCVPAGLLLPIHMHYEAISTHLIYIWSDII